MPESRETFDAELHLPGSDPAAPAVEALWAMAARPAPEPGAALAAFLADPAASGESPEPRRDPVTVVRIRARRAGRIAVAAGAALTLAALGGAALAATGGPSAEHTATVQQDEPSGTSTTSTDDETTSTETATSTESETSADADADADEGTGAPTARTANPTAAANHQDGVGEDDTHADVNGGGVVDHRAEHSPTAPPTGAPSVHPTGAPTEAPAATHPTGH